MYDVWSDKSFNDKVVDVDVDKGDAVAMDENVQY
jgi:hypothetical protein